jgi:hypothetical protein
MSDAEWDDLCELIESYNGIEFPRPCDTERLLELLEIQNDEARIRNRRFAQEVTQ